MMKRLAWFLPLLALAACGTTQTLKPVAGASLPPKASAARRAPTADELITPDSQSRPQRTDEALQRSEKRTPDRFDLPPT